MSADIETLKTNLNHLFLLINGSLIILMQECTVYTSTVFKFNANILKKTQNLLVHQQLLHFSILFICVTQYVSDNFEKPHIRLGKHINI